MDPGHKAGKNPSDNADLGFQAIGERRSSTSRGCQQQSVTSYSHWQRSITLTSRIREEEDADPGVCRITPQM